jgi:beta-galactosidase
MRSISYQDGRYFDNDAPLFIAAADYQYYRDRREHWEDRLTKLKASGVNTITFYIPWRHHLRMDGGRRGYDFTGKTKDSRDVVQFMKLIAGMDLYMIAKPGPFVHSELNIGGLPDMVSPTCAPNMPPARRHNGAPATWEYDDSILPATLDETFDALVKEWLEAVRPILLAHAGDAGRLIGIQLNDETIFCTSNDPPWHFGYEPEGLRFYHQLLAERYGDVATYNKSHGTHHAGFEAVAGPPLDPAMTLRQPQDLLAYVDWAEYQWRLRRDNYLHYKEILGVNLPYLTNYAGITPPIEENIPDKPEAADPKMPPEYAKLYAEWWLAMNRIDQDADAYEYGMISWLGVASYDRNVFDRYINTARRARGINMEENWGFGTLYDEKSRYPIVPFYQTLVSIAGGATGYVIFVGVSTDYWDESLDRITKKQCPTFPSHAPIDEHGNCRPMYHTATMLNRWFIENGEAFLKCRFEQDAGYLLYAPYAAVSSWVPGQETWRIPGKMIPRCGREGFEEFSKSLQQDGYSFAMFELESATPDQMNACRALAIQSAFFMDADAQNKLATFIESRGRLLISGDLPEVDLQWRPCTRVKDAIANHPDRVVYRRENMFADGAFAARLAETGILPNVTYSHNMRAYVYRGENEFFVFFFNFDLDGVHEKHVNFYGRRLDLQLGSKTSGVVRIRDGRLAGYLVKGHNEVENIESEVKIQFDQDVVQTKGDFSSCR